MKEKKDKVSWEDVMRQNFREAAAIDKRALRFILVVPSSPQVPTPGREFLLKTPIEGVSYIATVLGNAGYCVQILDYRTEKPNLKSVLKDRNCVIGIATFIDAYGFIEEFIKSVKQINKNIPVILGGPFVSSACEVLMRNLDADYAVLGEGELTILELMDVLFKNELERLPQVSGICYKSKGEPMLTQMRRQIRDLDSLPDLDFSFWPNILKDPHSEKLGFSSSRGCYSKCSFCFKAMQDVRQMSADRFCRQVETFVKIHGLKYAFINDLTFVIGRKRTLKMCKGLKKSGIHWACSTRVENIDEELFLIMKDSGCEEIWFGFESVDQNVLAANFKDITVEQINRAVEITVKAGIKVMGNFIIGLLDETEGSLNKMVQFIETKNVIPCSIKYLTPFPGTYVYDYARKKGLIKDEIEYFKTLSRRKVNAVEDEIVNCTDLPEGKLREAFKKIRRISYERYGDLDWNT